MIAMTSNPQDMSTAAFLALMAVVYGGKIAACYAVAWWLERQEVAVQEGKEAK